MLRIAAELGPGYHGRKRTASPTERQALATEFRRHGEQPPPYLDFEPSWIERRAKLFEVGDYPDKGVTITVRDLERLVANFELPVPIWIEHSESPLELGYLTDVSAEDGELYGVISLTEEANALIEQSDAHSLSIGLSPDLQHIREVSLVRYPRVPSAQLFSESVRFDSSFGLEVDWRARYEELVTSRNEQEAEVMIQSWVTKGQLAPSQAKYARVLLSNPTGIQFNGDTIPIRDLVAKLIALQPRHSMFGELAPEPVEDTSAVLLLPEEAAFYRKHFPDVSLESIAQKKSGRA